MDTTVSESNNVVELRPNKLTDTEGSKRAALSLTKAVGVLNFNPRIFCEEIRRQHPHMQAQLGRLIFKLLEEWARDYETGNYDRRTQDLVESAYMAITQPDQGELDV